MTIGGVSITLSGVVDLIILIGALCAAIYKIWDFFAKPTSNLKKKSRDRERARVMAILDEELPKRLEAHDLETRKKYLADRQQYLKEIKDEVIKTIGGSVTQNQDDLEALKISARDVLREKIMRIYRDGRVTRTMHEDDRDALIQYYKDYKALKGNSYIDDRYDRMKKWTVVYDDFPDD